MILEAIRSLRYGAVEVTIHNAKVVQVERKEKLRFAAPGDAQQRALGEGTQPASNSATSAMRDYRVRPHI